MKRLKLAESQNQLLLLRDRDILMAEAEVEKAKFEYQRSLNTIAKELGVKKEERGNWRLDEEVEYLQEKVPEKVKPTVTKL